MTNAISDLIFNYMDSVPFDDRVDEIYNMLNALGYSFTKDDIRTEYESRV